MYPDRAGRGSITFVRNVVNGSGTVSSTLLHRFEDGRVQDGDQG